MKKTLAYCLLLTGVFRLATARPANGERLCSEVADTTLAARYESAYDEMASMLNGKAPLSIKRAVFLAEWAYLDGEPDYDEYCRTIDSAALFLRKFIGANELGRYKTGRNLALTEYFFNPYSGNGYKPFTYDFDYSADDEDFTRQFVTPLMRTHRGQCRSLPMYYRILAEALGAEASIAYAPAHMFIRYRNEDGLYPEEWVNVELTTHQITPECWYREHFEISDRQVEKRIYLHPLTDRQTVAAQLVDLALGYRKKFARYDAFTLRCVEKAWEHYSSSPNALLIQGNSIEARLRARLAKNGNRADDEVLRLDEALRVTSRQLDSLGWAPMSRELFDKLELGNEEGKRIANGAE